MGLAGLVRCALDSGLFSGLRVSSVLDCQGNVVCSVLDCLDLVQTQTQPSRRSSLDTGQSRLRLDQTQPTPVIFHALGRARDHQVGAGNGKPNQNTILLRLAHVVQNANLTVAPKCESISNNGFRENC